MLGQMQVLWLQKGFKDRDQEALHAIAHVAMKLACRVGPASSPGSQLELAHGPCPVEDWAQSLHHRYLHVFWRR